MDKNTHSKDLPVMIGLFLMVALLVLFMYKAQDRLQKTIEIPIPDDTTNLDANESTPKAVQIQGPGIYTNSTHGFAFTVPKDVKVVEFEQGATIDFVSNNKIVFYVSPDNSDTIADYLIKVDEISRSSYEGMPASQVQSTSKTVINGLNCIQRKEYIRAADLVETVTYFKNGPIVVTVVFQPVPGNETASDLATYNGILSTFEFTK